LSNCTDQIEATRLGYVLSRADSCEQHQREIALSEGVLCFRGITAGGTRDDATVRDHFSNFEEAIRIGTKNQGYRRRRT
jgi:hypothetical protein